MLSMLSTRLHPRNDPHAPDIDRVLLTDGVGGSILQAPREGRSWVFKLCYYAKWLKLDLLVEVREILVGSGGPGWTEGRSLVVWPNCSGWI